MLVRITDLPEGVLGLRAEGLVTVADYTAMIGPEIERLSLTREQLRLVLHLGREFAGFGEGAWGELTEEIRHTPFERGVVVTDDDMVRSGLFVLKWVLRGTVRTFRNRDFDEAVRWVAR